MKKILILLLAIATFSCTNDIEKVSKAEMQAYEKEVKEKIKVAKVSIVQMKLDLQEMSDSLSKSYTDKLNDFEERLNSAEEVYNKFKNVTEKEIWTAKRANLDSTIGYLELEIDSTKINIEQLVDKQ